MSKATVKMRRLLQMRPKDVDALDRFVRVAFDVRVPRVSRSGLGAAPMGYLAHCFFEPEDAMADTVVWANRGGGKTLLGALATLLDLVFKPGIEVRILGGSLEQAARMQTHLLHLLDQPMVRGLTATAPTRRRIELLNGSVVELLAQSHRSVRGNRVHKLRCDEVEEFHRDVWAAAQLTTRTQRLGGVLVRGAVDALSTAHRPFGLMHGLTKREDAAQFRWNFLDVVARCEPERACEGCVLWADCRGVAKGADGFVPVDELVRQRMRSSDEAWASEMACKRPQRRDTVYGAFDEALHVEVCAAERAGLWVMGMDFGLRSPTVMLWAKVLEGAVLHVVDAYHATDRTLDQHLDHAQAHAKAMGYADPSWIAVDPAGLAGNGQTGRSDVALMKQRGYRVLTPRASIREGIELVRRRLDRGELKIDPRCKVLIRAMHQYHFDPQRPENDTPVKDGPDHACDALRYLVLALERRAGEVRVIPY